MFIEKLIWWFLGNAENRRLQILQDKLLSWFWHGFNSWCRYEPFRKCFTVYHDIFLGPGLDVGCQGPKTRQEFAVGQFAHDFSMLHEVSPSGIPKKA